MVAVDSERTARFERLYTAMFPEIAGYVRRRCGGAESDDVLAQVFASIPGVRILGLVTDCLGRTGVVVAYVDRPPAGMAPGMYGLVELIFAPKTSALLDEQTVLVNTRTHSRGDFVDHLYRIWRR